MSNNNPRTRIIGVGNQFRSDDSVGVLAARTLSETGLFDCSIVEHQGDGANLMSLWAGFTNVIIIDAVSSGSEPGTIFRLDASVQEIPSRFFNYSSHAFSVAEAVEMARTLGSLPDSMILYGIEGKDFSNGTELTDPVRKALDTVISELTGVNITLH